METDQRTAGAERAAEVFVRCYRKRAEDSRRSYSSYRPAPGLRRWCAWEDAVAQFAHWIAVAVAAGRTPDEVEVEAFRIAQDRMFRANSRYLTAARARLKTPALAG